MGGTQSQSGRIPNLNHSSYCLITTFTIKSLLKISVLVNRKKKSHLCIENKLLIYKAVIKPIWSYGIEPWGCASKCNIAIMQRSQSKILRAIAIAPWYVTNRTLHTDFNIPYVTSFMKESINITANWKPIPIHYYSHNL